MFMLWFLLISLVLGATVGVTYTGVKSARENAKSKNNNEDVEERTTEEEVQERTIPEVRGEEKVTSPEQQRRTPASSSAKKTVVTTEPERVIEGREAPISETIVASSAKKPVVATEPERVIEGRETPVSETIVASSAKKPVVTTEPERVIEGREAPISEVVQVPQAATKIEVTPEPEEISPEKIAEVLLNEKLMKKVVIPYAKLSKKSFAHIEDYAAYFLQEGKFITNENGEKVQSPKFLKKLDIIDLLNDTDAMSIARAYAQARKQKFTKRIDIATFFITEKGNALDSQSPQFEKTMKKLGLSQKR